jgi:hypothetical protein
MITTIISYCNNDFKFIEENLEQVSKFSNDIYISYCTKSLDGKPEDEEILEKMFQLARKYEALPVKIDYQELETAKFHHNLFRFLPTWFAKNEYILFLDADEILEGDLIKKYLETEDHLNFDAISFECYWYFRDKKFRAKQTEGAGTICRKSICTYNYIFSEAERWEFINRANELKIKMNLRVDDKIVCHHYSWVRTKEEMINKVLSWGHKNDKDWVSLIEEEFSHDFNGSDFVHNYKYDIL